MSHAAAPVDPPDRTTPMPRDVAPDGEPTPFADFGTPLGRGGVPSRIGPYRLLRLIGEGGMGEVWEAEQRAPIARRVAVKLIRLGMESRQVVARFESERQALARMEHPCIARVIDGGETASRRPYFVMEFVEGVPLLQYCDERRLTVPERLRLFLDVCDGVRHAHLKGVLHRDLKPSNVLVTEVDGEPLPKIIDFGVAKAIAEPLTDGAVHTLLGGGVVGTPAYMSPEQAAMSVDLDMRTDVYSLGVMLYELLAGVRPFELGGLTVDEMRRLLQHEEPRRPSARVAGDDPAAQARAAARRADPPSLARRLRGDLDWIVLKALEKDRRRRYDSPGELADDLRCHLESRPVRAGSPGQLYRLRKFVGRHALAVTAAGAVGLSLCLGAVAATWQALRATRAEQAAVEHAERAEREARAAERTLEFLTEILGASDPARARGAEVTAREVLDRAAARLGEELPDEPLVRARVQRSIAGVYEGLGLYDRAAEVFEQSLDTHRAELGADHPSSLVLLGDVATAWWRLGRYDEAEPQLRHVHERLREQLGPEHPDTLEAGNDLANLFYRRGDQATAEELYRAVVEGFTKLLGADAPRTLGARNNLANALDQLGREAEAASILEQVLERRSALQGADHPDTLGAAANLATTYVALGRLDEAEALERETLAARRRVLGPEHPETLTSLNNLARLHLVRGRPSEARELFREVTAARSRALGADHDQTLTARLNLGLAAMHAGDLGLAEIELRAAAAGLARAVGPEHTLTLTALEQLALVHAYAGRDAEAERRLRELVDPSKRIFGERHPQTLELLYNLACLASRNDRTEAALGHLEEVVAGGWSDPSIFDDPDLAPLREDPRFEALAMRVRSDAG
jgi:eukaryotic-like serine/threonine-protein kinase